MTDATASYCARVFPPEWRVMGVLLHPLTLGHAHLLCAATNWRPFEPYHMDDQLFAAGLYICSRPWRKVRLESNAPYWFACRLAIQGRLARVDLAEKGGAFSDFLLWHTSGPRVRPIVEKTGSGPGRPLGSPVLARLRAFAAPHGGMDALFGEVYWLWAAQEEASGNFRVLNEGETSFDDYCQAEDARGG